MAPKLSFLIAIVLALALLAATSAPAAGIQHQQTASRSALPTQPSSSLIAPAAACPNQANASASPAAQEQSMRCMTDFARARAGLDTLDDSQQLDLSAEEKAADVLSCDSFSHTACDRDFTYWMRQSGYLSESCWHVGENLAWGTGAYGTVRSIFQAWMRSPGHRHNILGDYEDLGLNLQTGALGGLGGVDVWTAHFGSRCETVPTPG
ncbi:MAG: hypothetical protein QOF13_1322 [Solirubrobacterales bacterium]|jgi:uncharacterized protein YkwD|nr:hypothetical protein [Solirubrobacterales bacterium]